MAPSFSIKTPASILIAGPSGCGKSQLCFKIVQHLEQVFDRPPLRLIICHACDQNLYDEIRNKSPIPVQMVKGIPPDLTPPPRSLVIVDDLQEHCDVIAKWFTKYSHHLDCSILYLTQNLFLKNPHHRTCSLNAHILVVFKSPRDKSAIFHLARQVMPSNPKFLLSAYEKATQIPHGYLVLNLKQDTPDVLRYRDSLLPTANFFVDKKQGTLIELSIWNVSSEAHARTFRLSRNRSHPPHDRKISSFLSPENGKFEQASSNFDDSQ